MSVADVAASWPQSAANRGCKVHCGYGTAHFSAPSDNQAQTCNAQAPHQFDSAYFRPSEVLQWHAVPGGEESSLLDLESGGEADHGAVLGVLGFSFQVL